MIDWAAEIARLSAAKRLLLESDTEKLWRHETPRSPATSDRLQAAMQRVGDGLDTECSSFLLHADGWPAILQDIDLFGTAELLGPQFSEAQELVATLEPEVLAASNIDPESLISIGASRTDIDLFVMPRVRDGGHSPVIWVAGLEVERYETFVDFFRGMIAHNTDEASDLQS